MNAVESLRLQSDLAHQEMTDALDGVTEAQSWAVLPNLGPDYLHSDASIHGIALHVATGKMIYASMAFHDAEIRWSHLADRVEGFEPNWEAARRFLDEAHQYWLDSWSALIDGDLEREVRHFSGQSWPIWKIIRMVNHHDSYHAGQVAMLRYGCPESENPPPSVAEDIRTHCKELPSW